MQTQHAEIFKPIAANFQWKMTLPFDLQILSPRLGLSTFIFFHMNCRCLLFIYAALLEFWVSVCFFFVKIILFLLMLNKTVFNAFSFFFFPPVVRHFLSLYSIEVKRKPMKKEEEIMIL